MFSKWFAPCVLTILWICQDAWSDAQLERVRFTQESTLDFLVRAEAELGQVSVLKQVLDSLAESAGDDARWHLYQQHQVRFLADRNDIEGILPTAVWQNQKGTCLGSALWLILMERSQGRQATMVLLPGHVIVQSQNGEFWEPNREGWSYTVQEYQQKYAKGPWTHWELKALNEQQMRGIVAFQLANAWTGRDQNRARIWIARARELFPEYPGIQVNFTRLYLGSPKGLGSK